MGTLKCYDLSSKIFKNRSFKSKNSYFTEDTVTLKEMSPFRIYMIKDSVVSTIPKM